MNTPLKVLSHLGNWPKFAQPIQDSYQDILASKPSVRPSHSLSLSAPQGWNQNLSTGEASLRGCRSVCCGPHAARSGRWAPRPRPRGAGTYHVSSAAPAAAAPPGRNAAPPRPGASETALSRGLTSKKAGPRPARRRSGRGAKGRDPGGNAPRCGSVSDWTRESSHFGFEAGGGAGAEPGHAPRPSAAADWPGASPRSVLEGSPWSSPRGSAEDWLFRGALGGRGCDRGGRPGSQVRRSATRLLAGAGGREGEASRQDGVPPDLNPRDA